MPCDDCTVHPDSPPLAPSECFCTTQGRPNRRWLLAAAVGSLAFHGLFLLLASAIQIPLPDPDLAFRSSVDDRVIDAVGKDPEHLLLYEFDRIEEVGVPAPVEPTEAVGVRWAAENPPFTMVVTETSGMPRLLGVPSSENAPPSEQPHGFRVQPAGFQGRSGADQGFLLREMGGSTLRPAEQLPPPRLATLPVAVPPRRLVARPAVGVASRYHPMILEALPHERR